MIDCIMDTPTNRPVQDSVWLMIKERSEGITPPARRIRLGKKKLMDHKINPPHKLGRHPFNIITEEIYD